MSCYKSRKSDRYTFSEGKKGRIIVSLDELSCDHHYHMMAGLHLIPANPFAKPDQAPLRVRYFKLFSYHANGKLTMFFFKSNEHFLKRIKLNFSILRVYFTPTKITRPLSNLKHA